MIESTPRRLCGSCDIGLPMSCVCGQTPDLAATIRAAYQDHERSTGFEWSNNRDEDLIRFTVRYLGTLLGADLIGTLAARTEAAA